MNGKIEYSSKGEFINESKCKFFKKNGIVGRIKNTCP